MCAHFIINLVDKPELSLDTLERILIAKAEDNSLNLPVRVMVKRYSLTHFNTMLLQSKLDIKVLSA